MFTIHQNADMFEDLKDRNVIILSKYFDENTYLVAGMCCKCYKEADVKIISVNAAFLHQISKKQDLTNEDDTKPVKCPKLEEFDPWCVKHEFPNWSTPHLYDLDLWQAPKSPHNLIEEALYRNPWSLLVATIFLNKTSCMAARPVIQEFLNEHPDPTAVLKRKPEDLEKYFVTIGLKKRAHQIWRMSYDFVHKKWKRAEELHGIGKYGSDAYNMFCLGNFEVEPRDRFLKIYKAWVQVAKKQNGDDCSNCSKLNDK